MTGTIKRAELIKKVFNDALELNPEERGKFLLQVCADDEALRHEVESLLDSYNRVEDFLETPAPSFSASEMTTQILESEEASIIGKRVGAYRFEHEIGRGGMGTVYLATRNDGQFQKRVAIKLLRRKTENDTIVRRFHRERQILADLEHPNIARLLDGGTTENGLPYFVMEYVEGLPLNSFCDEQNLSVNERLKLFRQICAAVEFAHKHSIIHRDIKPSNILVTKEGTPKLLDFGIAKSSAQNVGTDSTATAMRVMTPEYASPEQMCGEQVTKATDIYSLGVLLYELVTGNRPYNFNSKSLYEIVQAICEDEPILPSSLDSRDQSILSEKATNQIINRKFPKKDLDKIILKALRKEPERRYTSVKEFSEDISRLLEGLPVSAQQDTIFYRGEKFFKRHQTTILSALAVAFVFLLVGFSLSFYIGRPDLNESNKLEFSGNANPNSTIGKLKGTKNAEAYYLYLKGQHLWNQRSVGTHRQAADLFQQAVEKDPEYALAYSGLANSYSLLSVWGALPPKEAFPKARAAAEKAVALNPELPEGHLSLAMVHWLYEWDWQAADHEFKRAIELDSNYTLAPHWYGLFLAEMGRFDEALAAEKRALEIEPLSIPINADLARVLFYARRYGEAAEQYRKTIKMNPNFGAFYAEMSEFYEAAGMWKEWYEMNQNTGLFTNPALKKAFHTGGIKGFWRKQLELSLTPEILGWGYFSPARTFVESDEKDKAFKYLNKAFELRNHRMAQIKVHPKMDNLRSDPRFIELLRRMNFEN